MRKKEILWTAAAILLAGGLLLIQILRSLSAEGAVAVVYEGKEKTAVYPLSADCEVMLEARGGGRNLLMIRDGEAWIEEADCPDRLCVKQGHISKNGQSLICLPHRLTVMIEGAEAAELDAVVR